MALTCRHGCRLSNLKIKCVALFYRVHNECGLDGADRVYRAEHVYDEIVVVFHVRRVYPQQVVEFSSDVEAVGHLRDALDDFHEVVCDVPVHLLQLHAAEHGESQIQLVGIQDGDIFLYIPFLFETFHSLEDWGRGKVHFGGQLLGCDAPFLLKDPQDLQIRGIKFRRIFQNL